MLDAPIRRIVASPLESLAEAALRVGIGANALTIFGFTMGLTAALLIAASNFLLGLACLAINRVVDVLDGMVARQTRPTPLGAFLDSTLDIFVYAGLPVGFALAHQQDALAAAFLLMGLMVAVTPGLAERAFLGRSGETASVQSSGMLGHTETFIAFALMCIAPRWMFSPLAYFYGALCLISGAVRVASTAASLRARITP